MSEYGIVTEAGTVEFARLLPGPIERVWAYLTESDKRGTWLASGPMELKVGGKVELNFRHADLSRHKAPVPDKYKKYEGGVSATARVTRCEPPRLLSYTWGGETDDASEVTFALTPEGDKVRLVLTHRRIPNRAEMVSTMGGWHSHLAVLGHRLAGEEPPAFWALHSGREEHYEARVPPA
jgi:uncharacterized protein YndB with AHSA1/START domain